ncbi:DsrE family protein [Flavobacteriaceae bacterium TP-CH-4]|uniref:DsrE family protein n=1 Tax=Pelagihabitans pacificus TaxID=2696054 RepID=A0A967E7B6_9FLAO|nr:DsrE family protein [Pelagihabitans pacificus]NHF60079.1 DsrE family protein [Pelagihabitans pacificus]
MRKVLRLLTIFSLLLLLVPLNAQKRTKGPIIKEFGEVFEIKNPDFKVDTTKTYKAVFDIMNSPEGHDALNKSIETAARFLNMHAQSGVPLERLKIALVVHNQASKDIITNEAYQKRYGTDNPNQALIKALLDVGGEVIFCGQSSESRGFPREDLIEGVQLSLSAMTALIDLQNQNYRLIKF